ncbi:MAG: HPF/RaiA family ribosome-associated protein [Planctomycetota bacterium]
MHIEISYRDMSRSDAVDERVRSELDSSVGRFGERLTRVEVHLGDHNASKPGPNDKRCMIEARPKGLDPVVVEAEGEDLYATIADASGKLRRVLDRRFEKHDRH